MPWLKIYIIATYINKSSLWAFPISFTAIAYLWWQCSSCTKFAKAVNIVSKGWIRTAGHYYSTEADEARKSVFPSGYNATKVFWLINSQGAYCARSGLIPVIKEIILVKIGKRKIKDCNQNQDEYRITCDYSRELSCMSTKST